LAQVTIKDIASKLNLSPSTISRALHNHPDICNETKQKVNAIAEKLDYHPNALAQSLKKRRTNTIGVIVPEIKHDFFSAVISGIEGVAYSAGYVIILCESNENYEREVLNTRVLVDNRIAGLLVSITQSTTNSDHFKFLQRIGIPIVFFDRVCDDVKASKVVVDDYHGGFIAGEHLIKSGYKKIAHLGGPIELSISRNRCAGYLAALKKYRQVPRKEYILHGGFHEQDGREGAHYLLNLKNHPDAIFAVNDPVAVGAYDIIRQRGMRIPKDVAVIGFSNNPISAIIQPPLTTIEQPAFELGQRAAEMLIEQIESLDKKKKIVPKIEILGTRLIIREST
jgi:DNA-binding LacI/PurR family transcriptional regulator